MNSVLQYPRSNWPLAVSGGLWILRREYAATDGRWRGFWHPACTGERSSRFSLLGRDPRPRRGGSRSAQHLPRLMAVLKRVSLPFEVLVIDDGCPEPDMLCRLQQLQRPSTPRAAAVAAYRCSRRGQRGAVAAESRRPAEIDDHYAPRAMGRAATPSSRFPNSNCARLSRGWTRCAYRRRLKELAKAASSTVGSIPRVHCSWGWRFGQPERLFWRGPPRSGRR